MWTGGGGGGLESTSRWLLGKVNKKLTDRNLALEKEKSGRKN
jgi:hypothetical protein